MRSASGAVAMPLVTRLMPKQDTAASPTTAIGISMVPRIACT